MEQIKNNEGLTLSYDQILTNKMTLYEYKMLLEDEQYDTVFSKGKFLDIVLEGNSKYVLYAIDKFFVEVIYDLGQDKIIGKGQFVLGDSLDKYSNLPKEI